MLCEALGVQWGGREHNKCQERGEVWQGELREGIRNTEISFPTFIFPTFIFLPNSRKDEVHETWNGKNLKLCVTTKA